MSFKSPIEDSFSYLPHTVPEMRTLDKSLFMRKIPLAAARIFNARDISRIRRILRDSKDLSRLPRTPKVLPVPNSTGDNGDSKCLLLRESIRYDDKNTWTSTIKDLHHEKLLDIIPYDLNLDYDYYTFNEVMSVIIPKEHSDETPTSFSQVGHVAHLNLRDEYLPYKHVIARVLRDKITAVTTVINKTISVADADNPFRTFPYEVLEGDDNLDVTVHEQNCTFSFNYGRVYWNQRLGTEHTRLVGLFKPGEAICDVMAGVGPFAVPAAKKGCFVAANDLNPDSFAALCDAWRRNKVDGFLYDTSNDDGAKYIRSATKALFSARRISLPDPAFPMPKIPRLKQQALGRKGTRLLIPSRPMLERPQFFSHYIMNLPSLSLTFLPFFIGLYTSLNPQHDPREQEFPLPFIHAYTFARHTTPSTAEPPGPPVTLPDDEIHKSVCESISGYLRAEIKQGENELSIHEVRQIAPGKRMYCVSFRLPAEVAWAKPLDENSQQTPVEK